MTTTSLQFTDRSGRSLASSCSNSWDLRWERA